MTNGKLNFAALFDSQLTFQKMVTKENNLPKDDINWFSYHIQAMVEEMGEVLKADKRWKTHRNAFYDQNNKVEEIADILITTLNLAIFSGLNVQDLYDALSLKISDNFKKYYNERNNKK